MTHQRSPLHSIPPVIGAIFLLICCVGCGRLAEKFGRENKGTTKVNFSAKQSSLAANSILPGKIMIYMLGINGNPYSTTLALNDENDSNTSLSLPNGTYSVYAFGWAGPNTAEGNPRCGFGDNGNPIVLSGGAKTISLELTAANCAYNADSAFSEAQFSDASLGFRYLYTKICTGGVAYTTSNCNSPSPAYNGGNYAKYSLVGYQKIGDDYTLLPGRGIDGIDCILISTGAAASVKRIPAGTSIAGYPRFIFLQVTIHSDASCNSAPIRTYQLKEGYANAISGLTDHYSTGSYSYLFVNGD